jgi:hypothetical protein
VFRLNQQLFGSIKTTTKAAIAALLHDELRLLQSVTLWQIAIKRHFSLPPRISVAQSQSSRGSTTAVTKSSSHRLEAKLFTRKLLIIAGSCLGLSINFPLFQSLSRGIYSNGFRLKKVARMRDRSILIVCISLIIFKTIRVRVRREWKVGVSGRVDVINVLVFDVKPALC